MLDSHPALAIPGETGFVAEMSRRVAGGAGPSPERFAADFVGRLETFDRFRAWKIDGDHLRRHLVEHGAVNGPDAIRLTYLLYAINQGKARYGDKTPDHVLQMTEIADRLPESVFVHVIRDGRDVALAFRNVSWGPRSVREAAAYWRKRVCAGRSAGSNLGSERYLEVRYERLVEAPGDVLGDVSRFVGVDYEPSMLDYRVAAERQLAMSPKPSEDRSLLRPPVVGLRDWHRDMSAKDAAMFWRIAGDTLGELGYDPSPAGPVSARRSWRPFGTRASARS